MSTDTRKAGRRLLTRREIAETYGIGVRTLEHHSSQGTGPREIRDVGREILYAESDLLAWLVERGYPADVAMVDLIGEERLRRIVREEVEAALRPMLAEAVEAVADRVVEAAANAAAERAVKALLVRLASAAR